jgi:hypothetical protein
MDVADRAEEADLYVYRFDDVVIGQGRAVITWKAHLLAYRPVELWLFDCHDEIG